MKTNAPARRLALIGDVHAEHERLEAALRHLEGEDVCHILCTGDIVDGRGCPNRSIELLQQHDVHVVRGNHDRWLLQQKARHVPNAHTENDLTDESLAYLAALPRQIVFATIAGALVLCHGIGKNDLHKVWPGTERMPPETSTTLDRMIELGDIDYVINGHMHFQTLIRFHQLSLINAGSLAGLRWPGFSILDLEQQSVQGFGYDGSTVIAGKTTQLDQHEPAFTDTRCFTGNWEPVLLFGLGTTS